MPLLTPGDQRVGVWAPQTLPDEATTWELKRFPNSIHRTLRAQIGPLANVRSSSGCALILRTDAPEITLSLAKLRHHQPYPQRLTATIHLANSTTWRTVPSIDLQHLSGDVSISLATGQQIGDKPQPVWMWLPPISTTSVASISVRDDATLAEPLVPAPTWLAIGDSITQGFSVSCPTETWVHRLQPHYGPAWNLGIGGCLIEPDAFTWALHEQPWQRICIGLGSNHAWRDSTLADVADRTETLVHAALATDCPHIAWILPPWKPLEVGQGPSHYMHVPLDQDVARRLTSIRETIRHTLAPYAPRMSILEDLTVKNDRLYPDGLHPTGHATAAVAENILKQWAP